MTENPTKEEKIVSPRPAVEDLSKEIEQSIERQPDDRIKVVRVFDNCYRCNWWVADKSPQAFWLTSGAIRKSRFIRATKTSEGLSISESYVNGHP